MMGVRRLIVEVEHEVLPVKNSSEITPLSDYFEEEYFKTKKVVYTTIRTK